MLARIVRLFLPLLLSQFCLAFAIENFVENLVLNQLPNGDIQSAFNFSISAQLPKTLTGGPEDNHSAASIFIPWLFKDLFHQFSINEFRLSVTQGFWRTDLWSRQKFGLETPSGTELLAKFGGDPESSARRWADLVHIINGLFCTSILAMLPQFSGQPKLFGSEGDGSSHGHWWFGTLGGESACTENLKSWKKLLPCKQHGLVMLMEPTVLLAARFHAISILARKEDFADQTRWTFSLFANTVHNAELLRGKDLSLDNLFERRLMRKCPVAEQSRIIVVKNALFGSVRPNSLKPNLEEADFSIFDVITWSEMEAEFDMKLEHKFERHRSRLNGNAISMHSFLKSTNQIGGRFCHQIANDFLWPLKVQFMQMVPWQVRVFLHTMAFTCTSTANSTNDEKRKLPFKSWFTLARDRSQPLLIELEIELPANSRCKIEMEYEAAFLRITDFPPDANSGIFVPGAILTIPLAANPELRAHLYAQTSNQASPLKPFAAKTSLRVFGEPLLILLPVPDFSMPFNVICLVCTTIAIFYGNVFALSTKLMKLVPKEEKKETENERMSLSQKLKTKIGTLWSRARQCSFVPNRWKEATNGNGEEK